MKSKLLLIILIQIKIFSFLCFSPLYSLSSDSLFKSHNNFSHQTFEQESENVLPIVTKYPLNQKKNRKKEIVLIFLIISLALDGFLGASLLLMTIISVSTTFEMIALGIDVFTLGADLILLVYNTIQIMNEKKKKIKASQKKSFLRSCFYLFGLIFIISPLLISPFFFKMPLALTIILLILSSVSIILYLVVIYHFFKDKIKEVFTYRKESFSYRVILKKIILFFLIIIVLCIIPIISHLAPILKYYWLLCAVSVINLVIFLFTDLSLNKLLFDQHFNRQLKSDLSKKTIKNLQKSLEKIDKNPFSFKPYLKKSQKIDDFILQSKGFQLKFENLISQEKNKNQNLLEWRETTHLFFFNLFSELSDKEKKLLKKSITSLKNVIQKEKKQKRDSPKEFQKTSNDLGRCEALLKLLTLKNIPKNKKKRIYFSGLFLRSA